MADIFITIPWTCSKANLVTLPNQIFTDWKDKLVFILPQPKPTQNNHTLLLA